MHKMILPELNTLNPNKDTTFKKLAEEIAECNEAVVDLREYERKGFKINFMDLSDEDYFKWRGTLKNLIHELMGEVMDIAQVCATQLYTFMKEGTDVEAHAKMVNGEIFFRNDDKTRFIEMTPITYKTIGEHLDENIFVTSGESSMSSIDKSMSSVISSMGRIAKLDKYLGKNGERKTISNEDGEVEYVKELVFIIVKSYGLLEVLKETYKLDISDLSLKHVEKLTQRGYIKKASA